MMAMVPRLVRFSGTFVPANGLPAAPVESATLAIFREQQGGTPLWQETQNVEIDQTGHYTLLVGSTQNEGIPLDLFASEEPRWLSVQFNRPGETEQPRVRLVSVPYALKAADAETLGGKPASAFMPMPSGETAAAASVSGAMSFGPNLRPRQNSGTINCIGVFVDATDLGCSPMWLSGGNIGVGTQNPTPANASLLVPRMVITGTAGLQGVRTVTPGGSGSQIILSSTRGSDANVYTALESGDGIGTFSFNGTDGTQFQPAAAVTAQVDGTVSTNNLPGRLLFATSPGGANVLMERMRITSSGNVGIGTTTPGAMLEVAGTLKVDTALVFPDGTQQKTAPGGGPGPAAIAQLRWYSANLVTAFPTGTGPVGAAFDGANIWVANYGDNTVTELRCSDGSNQGTYSAGGSGPTWVAYDGANIWVANYTSNTVTKLSIATGALEGTFTVGTNPAGLAFDGANIWVANYGSNTVTKLNASNGINLGTFAVGINPTALAFDGSNVWVVNAGSNSITQLRASDGYTLGTFGVGATPRGIAFDGADIWVTNYGSATVSELLASNGSILGTFSVGLNPSGVAFDGANIWVANSGANTVNKLRAADGSLQGTFPVGYAPNSVAFDGANIWVTSSSSNIVNKL
jgi:hypothetical protein